VFFFKILLTNKKVVYFYCLGYNISVRKDGRDAVRNGKTGVVGSRFHFVRDGSNAVRYGYFLESLSKIALITRSINNNTTSSTSI